MKKTSRAAPAENTAADNLHTKVASNRIFEILRHDIIQLKLLPGTILSEWEIARQFEISRQPVREAFIKLGEVGLVEIRPRRGTFVRLISMREVDNTRFLRETIEIALVRLATEMAEQKDIKTLNDVLAKHRAFLSQKDHIGLLMHDETFHRAIARIAQREDAWSIINGLKAQVDRVRFLTLPDIESIRVIIEQHEKVVQAIELRNPDAAEAAMRAHLHEIQNFLPMLQAQYPDLFTD